MMPTYVFSTTMQCTQSKPIESTGQGKPSQTARGEKKTSHTSKKSLIVTGHHRRHHGNSHVKKRGVYLQKMKDFLVPMCRFVRY
jgi:hypothetical protein